jgi:hypothetical protein
MVRSFCQTRRKNGGSGRNKREAHPEIGLPDDRERSLAASAEHVDVPYPEMDVLGDFFSDTNAF